MSKQDMKEEREIVEDAWCEALEKLVHENKITRDRATLWYRKAARQLGLGGLHTHRRIVPHPDPEKLKKEIKGRIENGNGKKAKLPITREKKLTMLQRLMLKNPELKLSKT